MKYLTLLLTMLCGTASGVTIWGSTDRTPATATMRFPVDTGAASSPGYLDIADVNTYVTTNMDAELTCLAALATTGLFVRTGAGTCLTRAVTGTAQSITVTNGDGVSGAPTLAIASDYPGQASIVTVGTIATGTWEADIINPNYGGNGLSTINDDQLALGTGVDAYTAVTLTDCNAADSAVTYDTATNAFGCNTIAGGGGTPGGSPGQLQWNSAGSFAGVGGTSVTSNVISFDISGSSATNAATATPLTMDHTTSGTATTGFGFTVPYRLEDGAGNLDVAASAVYSWTDATSTSEDTKIVWNALKAGVSTPMMTIDPGNSGGEVLSFGMASTGTEFISFGQPKIGMVSSGVSALWLTSAAKSTTNYALYQSASELQLRGQSNVPIRFYRGVAAVGGFDDTSRFGIGASSTWERQLQVDVSDAVTNAVTYSFKRSHATSGTAAAGFGEGVEIELEDAGGGVDIAARENYFWRTATAASEAADYGLDLVNAGTLARRLTITAQGHIDTAGVALVNGDLSSCGAGTPTAVGTDRRGEITVGTGGITSCTLTFDTAYEADPVCVVSAVDSAAATGVPYAATTTTTLTIGFVNSVASGTVSFICEG